MTRSSLNVVVPILRRDDHCGDVSEILQSVTINRVLTADIIDGCSVSEVLLKKTTSDFIIINRSHHPYEFPATCKTDSKFQVPYISLTGVYNFQVPNWVSFEYYFFIPSLPSWEWNYAIPYPNNIDKKYKFSCLNRTPKFERVWFYTQLHQQAFYKDSLVSFYKGRPSLPDITIMEFRSKEPETAPYIPYNQIDDDTLDYFEKHIYHTLPHCLDEEIEFLKINSGHFTLDIKHPAFTDAYINIISEHLYQLPFLTEKTVKPLASEQLFLMAGPVGAIKHIEDLGFDVFRDYIDHEYYDNESDWQLRLTKMLKIASDLYQQDIHAISSATELRRKQNCIHLTSDIFRAKLLKPLIEWIDHEFP